MSNDSDLLQIIAQNILKLRKEKKLSQEELAYLAGVNKTYFGYIENAKHNVSILTLEKIAKALDVSLIFLLTLHRDN